MESNCFYHIVLTSGTSSQHLYPQATSAFLPWRRPTLAFPLGLLITEGGSWGCWQFLVGEPASGRPSAPVTSVRSPSPFLFYRLLSSDSYSPPPPIPAVSRDSGNAQISCLIKYFLCGPPKLLSAPVRSGPSGVILLPESEKGVLCPLHFCTCCCLIYCFLCRLSP